MGSVLIVAWRSLARRGLTTIPRRPHRHRGTSGSVSSPPALTCCGERSRAYSSCSETTASSVRREGTLTAEQPSNPGPLTTAGALDDRPTGGGRIAHGGERGRGGWVARRAVGVIRHARFKLGCELPSTSGSLCPSTGCGAAWLARRSGGPKVGGSNPLSPTPENPCCGRDSRCFGSDL